MGRAAVMITAEGQRLAIISPHMLPTIASCDPELTYGLPPRLTAATGMDAISHCLETYMAPAFNLPSDTIMHDGPQRGRQALEGAMTFQKGLGAVHAPTHPLGSIRQLNLHHGTLYAVLMPAMLRFNRSTLGEKWGRLEALFDQSPDAAIAKLNERRGMPSGLSAMGVTEEMLMTVAGDATTDHCHATNPRTATTDEHLAIPQESP